MKQKFLLLGHIRKIRIPKCVEFEIRTNACRGYCVSYAIPSSKESISINPNQKLTSVSQCCNIMDTEDVSNSSKQYYLFEKVFNLQ